MVHPYGISSAVSAFDTFVSVFLKKKWEKIWWKNWETAFPKKDNKKAEKNFLNKFDKFWEPRGGGGVVVKKNVTKSVFSGFITENTNGDVMTGCMQYYKTVFFIEERTLSLVNFI